MIEQKLQLTERELAESKAKYVSKDGECREVSKELYQAKKECNQLASQIGKVESEKNEEIKAIRTEHEAVVQELQRQINQGVTGNPQVSEDLQQ